MKKVILIFALITIFYSCNSEESLSSVNETFDISTVTKAEIVNAALSKKIEYKKYHLNVLANWVSSKSDEIISLNAELKKKSNENKTNYFLLEQLVEDINTHYKQNDKTKFENEMLKIKYSLDAFKDLEGESWYPMIFINDDLIESQSKSSELPTTYLAIEDANDEGEFFTAYEIADNDEIVEISEPLTPTLIGSNDLLVMELISCSDEMVLQKGFESATFCGDSGGGGSSGGGSSTNHGSLQLEKMTIKDLKEGWPGRPEIAFKGYKVSNINAIAYDCNESIYASVNCWTLEGKRTDRIKRRWKNDERTYNFTLKTEDNNSDDIIYYIIFEQDSWPAPIDYEYFSFDSGLTSRIPYRSWQGIFDKQQLSQNTNNVYNYPYANNFSTENSDIKYNLKLK